MVSFLNKGMNDKVLSFKSSTPSPKGSAKSYLRIDKTLIEEFICDGELQNTDIYTKFLN